VFKNEEIIMRCLHCDKEIEEGEEFCCDSCKDCYYDDFREMDLEDFEAKEKE
jgi:hypothetical protein